MCSKLAHFSVLTRRIMSSPPVDNPPDDDSPGENENQEITGQNSAQLDSIETQGAAVLEEVIGTSGDHEKVAEGKEEEAGDVATGSQNGKSPLSGNAKSPIAESDDGFRTPTSPGHKIPVPTECPPAPRKAGPQKLKRKASSPSACRSLQFCEPAEVESLFRAMPDDDDDQDSDNADETKSKKARRDGED